MGNLSSPNRILAFLFLTLVQIQSKVFCYQYKVGDLDAWGIPTSTNPQVYKKWSTYHNLTIGDSLRKFTLFAISCFSIWFIQLYTNDDLMCIIVYAYTVFLYPPSQDSVIQVTEESYKKCNIKDPILYMNNGNSLFNITSKGQFYFTSGVAGHCQKNQKLHIAVGEGITENVDDAAAPASAPSYPTVFGNIPVAASTSTPTSTSSQLTSTFQLLIIGFLTSALFSTLCDAKMPLPLPSQA